MNSFVGQKKRFGNWMRKSNRHVFMGASLKMNRLTTYSIFSFHVFMMLFTEESKKKEEHFHNILST